MSELLWEKTKRKCTWVFKHSHAAENNHAKFSGYCKQCGAKINAKTTAATESFDTFECKIEEGDLSVIHEPAVKNKITKYKKNFMSERLKKEYPSVVRNSLLNITMKDSDT